MTTAPGILISPPTDDNGPPETIPTTPATTTTAEITTLYHPAMLPAPSYNTRTDNMNYSNNNASNNIDLPPNVPKTTLAMFQYTHTPHRHALAHPLVASILADPAAVWACDASWVEGVRGVLGEGWTRWVGRQKEEGGGGGGGGEKEEEEEGEFVVVEESSGDVVHAGEEEEESDEKQEEEEEEEEMQQQPPADVNDKKPKAVAAADSAATLSPATHMALAADEQGPMTHANDDDEEGEDPSRLLRRRSSLHVFLDRAAPKLADIKGRLRRAFVATTSAHRRASRGSDEQQQRDDDTVAAKNSAARDFLGTSGTAGAFYFPGF
ncbi:hypothetical protein HDU87_001720 [Geranomyces variabilis]|uniref:Uncharacterized protein n=1 Tax=Geranomyces variabilis TaxID=109894 RepID=A0AAD5TC65_9FUNG|nr:hypothetical protein HDU87_001720 [Geranomyces variabilis]